MVVDTMVVAYALLGVRGFADTAMAALDRAEGLVAPETIHAELSNILRQWARKRNLPLDAAYAAMDDAEALLSRVIDTAQLWETALAMAFDRDRPVSQAMFVAAAATCQTRVISFDRRLQAAFPEYVVGAADYAGLARPGARHAHGARLGHL